MSKTLLPILLVDVSGGTIRGRTRFQKLVFLFQQSHKTDGSGFKFYPWDYGPYSKELQEYLNALVSTGLVAETPVLLDTGGKRIYEYHLTAPGRHYLRERINSPEGKRMTSQVEQMWKEWGTRPLDELIHHVYAKHPEFTTRSKLLD